MTRSFVSEWVKLRRRGMLVATLLVIGIAALVVGLRIATAPSSPSPQGQHNGLFSAGDLTTHLLGQADGFARALGSVSTFVGAVVLSIFAFAVASEFSEATLRNLLVREPRRLRLMAGKLVALATFDLAAILAAALVSLAAATLAAHLAGVDSSTWFTGTGVGETAKGVGELFVSSLGWGLLGALLGLLLRSPAFAIAAGLAYALPLENLLLRVWSGGDRWLPGQLLNALASGGTTSASFTRAVLLITVYATAGLIAAAATFTRRDVTV